MDPSDGCRRKDLVAVLFPCFYDFVVAGDDDPIADARGQDKNTVFLDD
jgi:hypothetical protein